jgi:hypothetical protein
MIFLVRLHRVQTAVQTDPPLYHTAVQVAWTILYYESLVDARSLHCSEVVLLTTLVPGTKQKLPTPGPIVGGTDRAWGFFAQYRHPAVG